MTDFEKARISWRSEMMNKCSSVITAMVTLLVLSAGALHAQTTSTWSGVNANWDNPDSDSFTPPYTNGYTALFDGGGSATVNVYTGGVAPAAIIVTSSVNYAFSCGPIGIVGTGTLFKSGSGTLTLSGTSSYSGATIINGGTLDASGLGQNPLSNSSGLIFTGNSTFIYTGAQPDYALPSTAVNSGVTSNFKNTSNGNNTLYTMASLSGAGKFSADNPGGSGQGKGITFGDMSSFTGVLEVQLTGASFFFATPNLNDTVANNIRFAGGGTTIPMEFRLTGSTGLTLNNRAFEMGGSAGNNLGIKNNGSGVFIINKDLLVTAAGAKTLQLGGSNTGNNTFAGKIVNGSGTISLIKSDAGNWIISGTNTYTGATTINGGTLEIGGAGVLGGGNYLASITNSGTFQCNSTAEQIFGYAISGTGALIKDNTGKLTLNGDNTYSGATTIRGGTLLCLSSGSCSNSAVTVTNTPGITAAFGVIVNDNTNQCSVASLTFKTDGVGAQLQFTFNDDPSTNIAPLNIIGDLQFNGAPLVVVNGTLKPGTNPFPLLTVGGAVPGVVPDITASSFSGKLYWDSKTLKLVVSGRGAVLILK